ncbi:MAG: response regulator [Lachnospiraceae bacterium]|nr:response regulator [Lachnospiraceae bacterium]
MAAKRKGFNFRLHQLFVVAMAIALVVIMVLNVLLMYDIAAKQTEEIGRMRVQSIATGFQKSLTRAEYTLERVRGSLEEMIQSGSTEEEIRHFLAEQRNIEYSLSNEVCLNVFCVVDGVVMISDMETPKDYVLQDRSWYRGLLAAGRGEIYISPTYKDAFTDNMCFTVAIMLADGSTVGLDYSVAEIQSYVNEMGSDTYGDAMIVDANEIIVGYTNPDMIGKKLSSELPQYRDVFLRAVASDKESLSLRTSVGKENSTIFCSKTENGWYMMCSVSNSALYRENYKQMYRNFCFVLLLVFVIVIIYFLGLRERRQAELILRDREERHKENKKEKKQRDFTVRDQRKYQIGITGIFIVTMIIAISGSTSMSINESRIKMEEELQEYSYKVGDWILEQKSILDMFNNVVAAKPEMLLDYNGMVKFLDDITKHYPKISATYIANPDFPHGHPMVMNNGWVPEPDYVEEERIWYIGALTAEDFNITEPYYDARTGEYCITFSKVVKSDSGEFCGVFAIDFYLDVLMDILGKSYSEQGYAFLVDKNGLIIDHPNSDYEFSDEDSVNIHDLVYDSLYSETGMVVIKDYDEEYKVCASMDEIVSGFRIIVVKDWWNIYGNVLQYAALFLGLFGGCILAVNVVINKMIQWQSRANDNLKEAAESAIRAEQAKTRFLSNMSHEIRTPINAVLGMNEMILRECKDELLLSYAENIQSSGKTLLFLINDILDMSKIESGKMEIVSAEYDMADVITDLWNVIYLRAQEKSLTVDFLLDETLPRTLFGDEVRIKQIVTNMLTNAVKYTPKGGIELHVNYRKTGEDRIELIISVKDTGIGIRQEDMGKLFESFQRLDEKKNRNIEGTGLGMNITMSLLKLMGGDMKVESEYQKGSTFTVTIPQKVISGESVGDFETIMGRQRSESVQRQESFEAPDAKVLVVDDNDMNLAVFKALLKRTKMNIVAADSGRKCLELVKKEPFHIIFMDHMMPEMDGIETLHEIRKFTDFPNEKTPVIALTANALSGAKESYLKEGFADFLTKPIDADLLEKMVVSYLPKELVQIQEDTADSEISKDKLLKHLSKLRERLDTFEEDKAEALLTEISGCVYRGTPVSELLHDIRKDVEDFELGAAAKKVEELIADMESDKYT